MTRRKIFNLALGLRIGSVACSPRNTKIIEHLETLELREGLAVLSFGLSALTLSGKAAGKLAMPDLSSISPERAVAPDAEWVAWIPYGGRATPRFHDEPSLSVSTD